jgi:hypothetical protein
VPGGDGLERLGDEGCGVGGRQPSRREPRAREAGVGQPVDAEGAPVGAAHVPGDQVPAPTGGDELVRFHQPPRPFAVATGVVELDLLAVATGL